MKKQIFNLFLCLIGCIILTSCSSEMFDAGQQYTVTVNYDYMANISPNVDMRFYEYNANNEMISYKTWDSVPNNSSKTFRADDLAVKVVVYASVDTIYGESSYYASQIFYLSSSQTNINIDGETLIQKYNPIQ